MKLQKNQRGTFRSYDGRIITGRIIAIANENLYFVLSDSKLCTMFSDGLFRFTDRNLVTNTEKHHYA